MLTNLLQQIPFFEGVPPEALGRLADESFQKRYRAGDRVVVQGEYGHTMFVVVRGRLEFVLQLEDGSQRPVTHLDQPGQFFGELSVLSNARRTTTVIASAESVLLEIEKARIDKLAKEHGSVVTALEQ